MAQTEGALLDLWRSAGERIAIIECALAREFMLPLRTFLRADPDPLTGVIAALGSLRESELGVLQILFTPAKQDWASSVRRALTDGEGGPFFLDAPELTRLGLEKVSNPLFAVILRISAAASEPERAERSWSRSGARSRTSAARR